RWLIGGRRRLISGRRRLIGGRRRLIGGCGSRFRGGIGSGGAGRRRGCGPDYKTQRKVEQSSLLQMLEDDVGDEPCSLGDGGDGACHEEQLGYSRGIHVIKLFGRVMIV